METMLQELAAYEIEALYFKMLHAYERSYGIPDARVRAMNDELHQTMHEVGKVPMRPPLFRPWHLPAID